MATRLQLHVQRFDFEGLGFSMVLPRGWKGVAMNPLHGAFISSLERPQEAVLNVRLLSLAEVDAELTPSGLEEYLRLQEWGCEPVELIAIESVPYAMVGGTYPPVGERSDWVREWFLSDGQALANAMATPLICKDASLLAECEEMLRSLRFG